MYKNVVRRGSGRFYSYFKAPDFQEMKEQTPTTTSNGVNGDDTFSLNPYANEFVPLRGSEEPSASSSTSWDTFPSDQQNTAQGNNPSMDSTPCNGSLAPENTYYYDCSSESSGPIDAAINPSDVAQDFQPSNYIQQDLNPSFHYFPEPPNSSDQDQTEEEATQHLGEHNEDGDVNEEDDAQSESSTPVVPIKCTPIYKFIGYCYASTETPNQTLLSTPTNSGNLSTTTPMYSLQPQQEFVQPLSIPMQIPVMETSQLSQQQPPPPQFQETIPVLPVLSVPITQQLHQAVPNTPLSNPSDLPTHQMPGRPRSCVRVFVPNVPGSSNNNTQKGYPSLIPAIAPQQTGMYWFQ